MQALKHGLTAIMNLLLFAFICLSCLLVAAGMSTPSGLIWDGLLYACALCYTLRAIIAVCDMIKAVNEQDRIAERFKNGR